MIDEQMPPRGIFLDCNPPNDRDINVVACWTLKRFVLLLSNSPGARKADLNQRFCRIPLRVSAVSSGHVRYALTRTSIIIDTKATLLQ